MAEGYLDGRAGSGFFVCDIGAAGPLKQAPSKTAEKPAALSKSAEAPLRHPGFPDVRLFPYRAWARSLARSARLNPESLIVPGSPFGDRSLREAVARYLMDWRGLEVDPRQIMITAGSIDALETCIRSLAQPGDVIGLENPGYQSLHHIVTSQGMAIDWLEVGEQGAEVPAEVPDQPAPRMVILTPSHQFPLGGAMPPQRRLEFLRWAKSTDAWIIEDDYDSEFRYSGRPIPALASLDKADRTIYIGTFSKIFSVSLRLGYLVMPKSLIPDFNQTLSRYSLKTALPCQPALASFIDNGELYRHIRRARRIYGERRKILLDALRQLPPDLFSFDDHQAGMQIALKFRQPLDDCKIVEQALQQQVVLAPLSAYYGRGRPQSGILVGFCSDSENEIRKKVRIISKIITEAI